MLLSRLMVSFVPSNWKGHLGISVSELYSKNALGLLINNRLNFREERIIVRKIAVTFQEEQIIARKFGVNHRAKRIIIRKIARIKTIGVTKMRGNFVEISFQAKFLRKARNFIEIRLHYFCTVLYTLPSQLDSTQLYQHNCTLPSQLDSTQLNSTNTIILYHDHNSTRLYHQNCTLYHHTLTESAYETKNNCCLFERS